MAFEDIWRPRVDGVDDADSSAVNEIAEAVIELDEHKQEALTDEQLQNIEDVPNKADKEYVDKIFNSIGEETIIKTPVALELTRGKILTSSGIIDTTTTTYAVSQYIDVVVGEQYELHIRNNWGNQVYAFYDDTDTVISRVASAGTKIGTLVNEIVTVPDGATKLIVAPATETLYFVNKVTNEYKEESYKEVFKLHNKKILSFGDSLAEGGANDGVSYAHLIAENNNMRLLSKAVGGATMRVVSGSVNNIGVQVDNAIAYNSTNTSELVDFDFIFLEGGTNDVNSGTLGDIIDGYDVSTCDNTTFTGALEINISKIRNTWWSANIIYILAHKMTSRNAEKQKQFHDRIIEVCNKWCIPYVDIYNDGQITSYIDVLTTNCFPEGDETHPNITGYEKFYVPLITAKMKELI